MKMRKTFTATAVGLAITSDNGDLQGELNLVWERILPVL